MKLLFSIPGRAHQNVENNREIFKKYENLNFSKQKKPFEKISKFVKLMKFSKNMKILIFQRETFLLEKISFFFENLIFNKK